MPVPKGILLIIGGAEDKGDKDVEPDNKDFEPYEILKQLLPVKDKHPHDKIEVITTATTIPKEIGKIYQDTFARMGFKKVGVMNMENREDAANEAFVERINQAHAVLFSGGDQFRLSTILSSSAVIDAIVKRYHEDPDFIVAGTSAGAMAMSKIMLYRGLTYEAMLMGEVKMAAGLGLIDNCIIDTHFVKRGRIGRLAQAVLTNPSYIGIGLGEDTALVVRGAYKMECYGSGMVIILDGQDVKETNVPFAEEGMPLYAENFIMHMLVKGTGYNLKTKKFMIVSRKEKEESD